MESPYDSLVVFNSNIVYLNNSAPLTGVKASNISEHAL